jgi:hypothetical protein
MLEIEALYAYPYGSTDPGVLHTGGGSSYVVAQRTANSGPFLTDNPVHTFEIQGVIGGSVHNWLGVIEEIRPGHDNQAKLSCTLQGYRLLPFGRRLVRRIRSLLGLPAGLTDTVTITVVTTSCGLEQREYNPAPIPVNFQP